MSENQAQDTKVIRTLRLFSQEEWRRLGLFLQSPYFMDFPTDRQVYELYVALEPYYPEFNAPNLRYESLFNVLFKGQSFRKNRMDKLLSRLFQAVKRFIAGEREARNTREAELSWNMALFHREKNEYREYERYIQAAREELGNRQVKDLEDYEFLSRVEADYCGYKSLFDVHKQDINQEATLNALDTYFVLARLEQTVLYLSRRRNMPQELESMNYFMQDAASLMEKAPWNREPLLVVYYKAYLLLSSADQHPDLFRDFNNAVERYTDYIPQEKRSNFHTLLRNFSIREFHAGNAEYFEIAFELYKDHLEKGYLYWQGAIHAASLRNIVAIGMRLGHRDWVIQFLEKHRRRITGSTDPEGVYRFNMAVIHFHNREFETSYAYLEHQFEDIFYKLGAKRLEIKLLFETESPILESRIEAFHIYIFRTANKMLSDFYANSNRAFIGFLRRLIRPGVRFNKKRIEKIKQDILQETEVAEKDWLLSVSERMG